MPQPPITSPRNLALGVLAVLFGTELWSCVGDWYGFYHAGTGMLAFHATVTLVFCWSTIFFAVECSLALLGKMRNRYPGRLYQAVSMLAVLVGLLAYNLVAASMTLRFNQGTYLTLPLLQFFMDNLWHGLWAHMSETEKRMLVLLLVFMAASSAWIFRALHRAASSLNVREKSGRRRIFLAVWLTATLLVCFSATLLSRTITTPASSRTVNHLSAKLDPLLTFALSCYEMARQSTYETTLLTEDSMVRITAQPTPPPAPLQDRPNIIIFIIESFRHDIVGTVYQKHEITPNINRLAETGVTFTRSYAAANHTDFSIPSIIASLYPLRHEIRRSYRTDDPYPKMQIFDVLKKYGYTTGWFSSDIEQWCGLDNFIRSPSLDCFLDATGQNGDTSRDNKKEQEKTKRPPLTPDFITASHAMEWMTRQLAQKKPFYATINLMDTHFGYRQPKPELAVFQPAELPPGSSFGYYAPENRNAIWNAYCNSLRSMDATVGDIVNWLHQHQIADNTIIVLMGDHGECFLEHGLTTHGKIPYDPSIQTTLLMHGPKWFNPSREDYPTSLVDVVPTLFAKIGIPAHPNFQGIDVLSMNRPPLATRCLYAHCNIVENTDVVWAAGRWKYFEDNLRGTRYLFDLANDPGEMQNLSDSRPEIADVLQKQLNAWRTVQLAYYRSTRYYSRFFPPAPPVFKR